MQRNASAHWEGGIKQGEGSVSTDSGVLQDRPYSYDTRFNGFIALCRETQHESLGRSKPCRDTHKPSA